MSYKTRQGAIVSIDVILSFPGDRKPYTWKAIEDGIAGATYSNRAFQHKSSALTNAKKVMEIADQGGN
jgi:hypothetical protein